MERFRANIVVLALMAGTLVMQPASATEASHPVPNTARAYATCTVTDEAGKTLYATAPGRVDAVTVPASVDAQEFSAWVARVYNVPSERLSAPIAVLRASGHQTASSISVASGGNVKRA